MKENKIEIAVKLCWKEGDSEGTMIFGNYKSSVPCPPNSNGCPEHQTCDRCWKEFMEEGEEEAKAQWILKK